MKKSFLIASIFALGLAGIAALFAPQEVAQALGLPANELLFVLIQVFGALYFAMALMNWTAKDSPIGGIYARPVTLANLTHFTIGALILIKYQVAQPFSLALIVLVLFYTIFALIFGWLVFRASGLE